MSRATERHIEAIPMDTKTKKSVANLTTKQFAVYSYLLSISLYNQQEYESHYYVYKDKIKVGQASKLLNISTNTWRNAIKVLEEKRYIKNATSWYEIRLPNKTYAVLDKDLIRCLLTLDYRTSSGLTTYLYATLYYAKLYCNENKMAFSFTISQLCNMISGKNFSKNMYREIKRILAICQGCGILYYDLIPRTQENFKNKKSGTYYLYDLKWINKEANERVKELTLGDEFEIQDLETQNEKINEVLKKIHNKVEGGVESLML